GARRRPGAPGPRGGEARRGQDQHQVHLRQHRRERGERAGDPGRAEPRQGRARARLSMRLKREDVERMMAERPAGTALEEALEVYEVFASGTLADEVYILDDVGGKRIAIAPSALKAKYRKDGPIDIIVITHEIGAGGPEIGQALGERLNYRCVGQDLIVDVARRYGLLEEKLSHLDEAKPSLFERFDAETRRYITVIQT